MDQSDPRAQEPLVDLAEYEIPSFNFYARRDGLNTPYRRCFATSDPEVRVRKSLAERLADINEELTNLGIEIYALNGFRPLSVQQELWDFFVARARRSLKAPTDEECIAFAGRYCSDPRSFAPDDARTWPTHITGGAIDLTLRNKDTKEHLFFGGIFDDPSDITHTTYFEEILCSVDGDPEQLSLSDQEALQNRRLLYWAMCSAGFTNYAYEWWHFDLGTQLWAANRSLAAAGEPKHAWYGPAST
ncbi:M15 family metallopeptidase [Roseibium sp. RKSG952]|uniref:M15 family metallopeptidase n=1 Tax=Roseibium sp. RKSG952 TaxID=2529384 RepID=UPI0018AD227D